MCCNFRSTLPFCSWVYIWTRTSVLNAMFGEKGFEYIKFSPIVSLQAFDGSIKLFFY